MLDWSLSHEIPGVPVSYSTLRNIDWEFVDVRYPKRCDSWIGRSASTRGRLILLNSSLSSIVYYHMSMFLLSKTFIERLDKYRINSFGVGARTREDITLSSGLACVDPKRKGVLVLKILRNIIFPSYPSGGGN